MNKFVSLYLTSLNKHWNNEELFDYGMRQLKMSILNILTILILGFLFNLFVEGIIFSISYIFLRKFTGGFHGKTRLRCFIYSLLLYIAALLIVRFIHFNDIYVFVLGIVFLVLIYFLPVEHENRVMNAAEKKVFRSISLATYLLCFGVILIWNHLGHTTWAMAVLSAVAGDECLIIMELIRRLIINRK